MSAHTFGPRRSRDSRKPDSQCPEPEFFRCGRCGAILHQLGGDSKNSIECCGQTSERLQPVSTEALPPEARFDYQIAGGPNDNVIRVFWSDSNPPIRPQWLYLKTFTGGLIRFLSEAKRSPAVFPLTDEDAYVYCDKDPCVECAFRCKRGFVLYGWFEGIGLVRLPLDRLTVSLRK